MTSWTFSQCLILFPTVEGIFFPVVFCAIFWLKQCGILSGLCFSSELLISCAGEGMLHSDSTIE
jgi:hypothetical protein